MCRIFDLIESNFYMHLEEDVFLTSQSGFEMTNVSATPSGLVHCEEVKVVA